MNPSTNTTDFELRLMTVIKIFATRLSRYFYLQHYCLQDHPVLITEERLLEMAISQMKELVKSGIKEQEILFKVKSYIRDIAKFKIMANVDDEDTRKSILQQLQNYDFDQLLTKSS